MILKLFANFSGAVLTFGDKFQTTLLARRLAEKVGGGIKGKLESDDDPASMGAYVENTKADYENSSWQIQFDLGNYVRVLKAGSSVELMRLQISRLLPNFLGSLK